MKVQVQANRIVRDWPHVEKYQNTTLRYTPDNRFPEVMEKVIGKPEIIRLFVTLDEVWDYRSNTYDWNYLIGVHKYEGDEHHYHYDWPLTVPSPLGVHEEDYLLSHAKHANKVLLNIRRYEREVFDGIISIETYEEVFEKVVEYYKELLPNTVYIECCNEVEIPNFGNLTMKEYYLLYQCAYRSITRLNKKHQYEIPLQVGGFGMSAGVSNWKYWEEFLELLSKDEARVIDFYSMHEYHTNPCRILEFYIRHEAKIKALGLPGLPLMMSEYGLRVGIGDAGRPNNLQNASGEIAGMILASYCEQLKVFPWCTFHNPNQQMGRTMFLINEHNEYVPTPSGHVMTMLHMLGSKELLIEDYTDNKCVATMDDKRICILISNPAKEDEIDLEILNLKAGSYEITEYLVDEVTNNVLYDQSLNKLIPTKITKQKIEQTFAINKKMLKDSFCLWTIKNV